MSKTFQAPATLTRLSFTSDGGLNLGFVTQELRGEEKENAVKLAINFHRAFGWVLFKESETRFNESEIPAADVTDESKSPSQRLRGVIFVYWTQRGKKGDFEEFYRRQMEKIINRVKENLE